MAQLVHALSADNNLVPLHLWWRKTRPKPENVSMFCTRLWHYFVDNKVKGRISKQVLWGKQITSNLPKNEHFLPTNKYTCVCISGGKKHLFFGNLVCFVFLVTLVLRFALLPYYRQFLVTLKSIFEGINWYNLVF